MGMKSGTGMFLSREEKKKRAKNYSAISSGKN
jgi:hypothetical protein